MKNARPHATPPVASHKVSTTAQGVAAALVDGVRSGAVLKQGKAAVGKVVKFAKEKPIATAAIAAGVGFVAGTLVSRRSGAKAGAVKKA